MSATSNTEISAMILCFNGAATLPEIIGSLRGQTLPLGELFVVDDGSTDDSIRIAEGAGVRTVSLGRNLGRGAARSRGVAETKTPFLLMCDATLRVPPQFLEIASPWMKDEKVAAVFGRVTQPPPDGVAARWRGRHLFKMDQSGSVNHTAVLATGACLLRIEAVIAAGGFDPAQRAGEDADLGRRLLAGGWQVVSDPALSGECLRVDSASEVLLRYARWNSPHGMPLGAYLRQISYSLKVMVKEDLRARDLPCAVMSLLCPHFQYWAPILSRKYRAR